MRFKVDENRHADVAVLFREHGHDAMTVFDQGMQGYSDEKIAKVCGDEKRVIVTWDSDFAVIKRYPPRDYSGIIVLRLLDQCRTSVLSVIKRILPLFATEPLESQLWIVEDNQLRIRGSDFHASIDPE